MPIKQNILDRVQSLPPLPASALQVIALSKIATTTAKELETIINQDPSLASAMLRQSNSAYYGHARQISSIQEAVVLLGFDATQGLVMSSAIAPMLKHDLIGYKIVQEGLWKHSLLTAMAAERLCRHKNLPHKGTAFTAGLLHDIGKLIICIYVHELGSFLQDKTNETKLPYVEWEENVIGYSHSTVGGFMARAWDLPDNLVNAISYHHSPLLSPNHAELASVIHIANALASIMGVGGGVDSFSNPIQQEPIDLLNLNKSDIEYLMNDLSECILDPELFSLSCS